VALAAAASGAGCRAEPAGIDGIFTGAGVARAVYCAVNLDSSAGVDSASIDASLDRAAARGELVELYAHRPGVTVPFAKLEHVLAGARARGLAPVTYGDLARSAPRGPSLALSFDDAGIAEWMSARELLRAYGARVTFFVTRYASLSDEARAQLGVLASDGHDVAAHGVRHLRAPAYVEARGVTAYLAEEALPSIEVLRADGYEVTAFAYPYGARTGELDAALLDHVPVIRSVAFPIHGAGSPCPD
jgi:peptidoglycan/xylan/chitin deacetylase (PgdA/CDA1 family)